MNSSDFRPASGPEPQLVGVAEVAARLGVTAERIRQLAKAGTMPDSVGRLGRQRVWRWTDVESWAKQEGRLASTGEEGRQLVRSWRQGPVGSLRLVVDEVMTWGSGSRGACHVRVWAPPMGSSEPHVVLLGQLNDFAGRSVSNEIETVAMTAALRYLGSAWRQAQFYEYSPPSPLDDRDAFLHVTFTVRSHRPGGRRVPGNRVRGELAKSLGGELIEPSWRFTTREEIERLTGDTPQVWMPGTYTAALLAASAERPGERCEVIWDPERSRDLADLAASLGRLSAHKPGPSTAELFGIEVNLTAEQFETARLLVAQAALAAKDRAEQDAKTQPADAAIWLNVPAPTDEAVLFSITERGSLPGTDPAEIWGLVTKIRRAVVDSEACPGNPALCTQRQLLVPGLYGGLVTLAWFDANIDEPIYENVGWLGPIALPSDLVDAAGSAPQLDPIDQLVFLVDVLTTYLEDHWELWREHNVPQFTPSTALSAKGPITRSYLSGVNWRPSEAIAEYRLRRLQGVLEVGKAGLDPDGWLVVISPDGKEFACEWPVSGDPDAALGVATIRADRSGVQGPTPVYVQRPDGRLQPLPSARNRHDGNTYTWGYPGTGPSNLAAATVDLLDRAARERSEFDDAAARNLVHGLVGSPRLPEWSVDDLFRRVERSQLAGPGEAPTDTGSFAAQESQ